MTILLLCAAHWAVSLPTEAFRGVSHKGSGCSLQPLLHPLPVVAAHTKLCLAVERKSPFQLIFSQCEEHRAALSSPVPEEPILLWHSHSREMKADHGTARWVLPHEHLNAPACRSLFTCSTSTPYFWPPAWRASRCVQAGIPKLSLVSR